MTIEGIDDVIRQLDQMGEAMQQVASDAVVDYAFAIMGESMEECPHDTGDLRRSNFVDEVEDVGMIISLVMGYALYYAVYVHENLFARHPNGGKAKFLEDPMMRYAPGFPQFVADRLSEAIRESMEA
jgi:hypothetical protein